MYMIGNLKVFQTLCHLLHKMNSSVVAQVWKVSKSTIWFKCCGGETHWMKIKGYCPMALHIRHIKPGSYDDNLVQRLSPSVLHLIFLQNSGQQSIFVIQRKSGSMSLHWLTKACDSAESKSSHSLTFVCRTGRKEVRVFMTCYWGGMSSPAMHLWRDCWWFWIWSDEKWSSCTSNRNPCWFAQFHPSWRTGEN